MVRLPPYLLAGLLALSSAWGLRVARRQQRALQIAQRQLAALTNAVRALAHAAELDDFLADVIRAIAEQLGARWVLLFLHHPAEDVLALHLLFRDGEIVSPQQGELHFGGSIAARDVPLWNELVQTRRPILVADVRTDPRLRLRDSLLAQGVYSMLLVPLVVDATPIGWFSVRNPEARAYSPDELELAVALAQQAALAVQLTRLGEHGRQAAVLEERNRMAREIHDTLAQGFIGILVQLEATESALDSARPQLARERFAKARELARTSLSEARRSVWALRPQALQQQPLIAALRAVAVALIGGTDMQLSFDVEGTVGYVSSELETDLLRVVQEAITNSVKHAAAHTVTVRVRDDGRYLVLQISDDGAGFIPNTSRSHDGSGFGLTAMRERIERHGGTFSLGSALGQGTEIQVRVERHQVSV